MGKQSSLRASEQDETIEFRAAVEISAPRRLVWDLIKPAENAPIFDPQIRRAVRAEGTPDGVGEMQVFIQSVDGREYVTAAEITEEADAEFVIMRIIDNGEFPSRSGLFLTDTATGTGLEMRHQIIAPKRRAAHVRHLVPKLEISARAVLKRVKVIAESRNPGLRAWNGENDLT